MAYLQHLKDLIYPFTGTLCVAFVISLIWMKIALHVPKGKRIKPGVYTK